LNITYASSTLKEVHEISDEDDVISVKAQIPVQRRRTDELEARQAALERSFKDLETENEKLRQDLRLKAHSQTQLELMLKYRETEQDELKTTVERLQAIYTRACAKLKGLEDQNKTLQIVSRVREQSESGQDTIEWADQVKGSLGVADQALHFYNALKFNHKLLKETEQRLAEANAQIDQLKAANSLLRRQEMGKAAENEPLGEVTSQKRPRADDFYKAVEGEDSVDRQVLPRKRPLSLLK
jgi:cell division protein FtsB